MREDQDEDDDEVEVALLDRYVRARLARMEACGGAGRLCEAVSDARVSSLVEQAIARVDDLLEREEARDASASWLYLRVPLPREDAGAFLSARLAPWLDTIGMRHPVRGWWWLYKRDPHGEALRLRLQLQRAAEDDPRGGMRGDEVRAAIRGEAEEALGGGIAVVKYEPELRLFGGPRGMALAHEQFARESAFLAAWAREEGARVPTVPPGLSMALMLSMLRAAGLDTFECWDVFERLRAKRPAAPGVERIVDEVRERMQRVAGAGLEQVIALHAGRTAWIASRYAAFLETFGQDVSRASFGGELECGLRAFFVPIVLFHWNRTRMQAIDQIALAHGMAAVLADLSRQGGTDRDERPVVMRQEQAVRSAAGR